MTETFTGVSGALQAGMDSLYSLSQQFPEISAWYTTVIRFVLPVLGLLILLTAIRSLLSVKHTAEVWAYLNFGEQRIPLTHWENILGRGGNSDVILNYPVVSRQHAALIRQADDTWTAYDLGSKGGVTVNGRPVEGSAPSSTATWWASAGWRPCCSPLSGGKGSAPPAAAGHAARVPLAGAGAPHRVPGPHRTPAHHQRGGRTPR